MKLITEEEKDDLMKKKDMILNKRPDITFIVEVIIFISFAVLLYYIYPYLTASNSPLFSKKDYFDALNKPESVFTLSELAKIRIERDSLKRYFEYFNSAPYSFESQGLIDLARGVIFLPIISFLLIYIVPPIVVSYIGWFIYTYYKYVIEALWGWFLMIYHYSTKLIECKLASKWYIRMVTGWHKCHPKFDTYFNDWKKKYVDVPLYYEKLEYIKKYYDAKDRYYTKPKKSYIDIPLEKTKVNSSFIKKTFYERTMDNIIHIIYVLYHNLYIVPRDQLYLFILFLNDKMFSLFESEPSKPKVCKNPN
jgi:hypothetical protein